MVGDCVLTMSHKKARRTLDRQQQHSMDNDATKELVLETLTAHILDSKQRELQEFAAALQKGDKLDASVLSGGLVNYGFKVFLPNQPDKALFAKLALSHPLWDVAHQCKLGLGRTECEFESMNRFASLMEDAPVVKPYLCLDVLGDHKLLVTEYATNMEQLATQYAQGQVDRNIIQSLARAIAKLNLTPCDEKYNAHVRNALGSLDGAEVLYNMLLQDLSVGPPDDFVNQLKEMGIEDFSRLMKSSSKALLNEKDVFSHGDFHAFNVLAPKQNEHGDGQEGRTVICDWEIAGAGPKGRDVGQFLAWPIVCAYCKAKQGFKAEAYDIVQSLEDFWDEYADMLTKEGGKDVQYLTETFRSMMGWLATLLVCVYVPGNTYQQYMPLDGVSEEDIRHIKGTYALTGLNLMEISFRGKCPELDLDDLRDLLRSSLLCDIETLVNRSFTLKPLTRQASIRRQRRRVRRRRSDRRVCV